ncbi:MAG: hypothetical protein LBE12_19445 [Planctomycetaceae bacterium]|nr:hypothetical protein [Planctomycetaceae bacterium]
MSQADYYLNDNNSACDTINYPLSTINYYLALAGRWGRRGELKPTPLGRAIILTPLSGLI